MTEMTQNQLQPLEQAQQSILRSIRMIMSNPLFMLFAVPTFIMYVLASPLHIAFLITQKMPKAKPVSELLADSFLLSQFTMRRFSIVITGAMVLLIMILLPMSALMFSTEGYNSTLWFQDFIISGGTKTFLIYLGINIFTFLYISFFSAVLTALFSPLRKESEISQIPGNSGSNMSNSNETNDNVTSLNEFQETLGKPTLNAQENVLESQISVDGNLVKLELVLDSCNDQPLFLQESSLIIKRIKSSISEIKQYASVELLDLKNKEWLKDDGSEKPLSSEEFIKKLKLISISLYPQSGGNLFFSTDLFSGHVIIVDIDQLAKPKSASL